MLLWIFCCLCVTVNGRLSPLTDDEILNTTSLAENDFVNRNTDVFRQLLNQETLIRIALVKNVHSLMKDMVDLKQNMGVTDRRYQDAEEEILLLKREVQTLKTESKNVKEQVLKFQLEFADIEDRFKTIESNFTKVANNRTEYENELDTKRQLFERNTSNVLEDVKIEVRHLSVTLLDLNKHFLDLDRSIPNLVENKLKIMSERLNESLDMGRENLLLSNSYHEQLSRNFSVLENHHYRIMEMMSNDINKTIYGLKAEVEQSQNDQLKLSSAVSSLEVFRLNMTLNSCDDINKTIYGLKAEVEQSQNDQLKLSSAVSSLEVFRLNMTLNSCGKAAPVGFTVGVTSSDSSWSGSTLVFPHVVYNGGNGYNPSTGIFTSPTDGTYVFFVNVNVYGGNYLYLDIVLNEVSKVRSMSHNTAQYMTGTNLAVLRLNKGDRVWIRRHRGKGYYSNSVPITTFSGFLL